MIIVRRPRDNLLSSFHNEFLSDNKKKKRTLRETNGLPLEKTILKIRSSQPSSGGKRCPSFKRIPRMAHVLSLRYFKPQAPGNWADNVLKSKVPSISVGTSIGSELSSSDT